MWHALKDINQSTGIVLVKKVLASSRATPSWFGLCWWYCTDYESAEIRLQHIEEASICVGLLLNVGKTKALLVNIQSYTTIKSMGVAKLDNIMEFKYLVLSMRGLFPWLMPVAYHGLYVCNKLEKIWKSKLDWPTKIKLCRACMESILLFGSEAWTIIQLPRLWRTE